MNQSFSRNRNKRKKSNLKSNSVLSVITINYIDLLFVIFHRLVQKTAVLWPV